VSAPEQARSLRVAAWLVAAEGVALMALGVTAIVLIFVAEPHDRGSAALTAVFALAFGVVLLLAGRRLAGFRRAAYAPVVLLQLLAIPVGISLVQAERIGIAVSVLVPAVAVLVLLLGTRGGRAVLEHGE
jgi:hypothetical protein